MINKELTKNEVNDILFKNEIIGMGGFGLISKYDEDTLIKIYYRNIMDTFLSGHIELLDEEIKDDFEKDKNIEKKKVTKKVSVQTLTKNMEQLEKTKSGSLIKGIATYQGQPLGVFLEYYKDYQLLKKVFPFINDAKKEQVLSSTAKLLVDLFENGIFPKDIKENNIMVRKKDLDVKLIDLDDEETRYEEKDFLNKNPKIKSDIVKSFEGMRKRLYEKDLDR